MKQFLKEIIEIDMFLIRDIDKDNFKKSIVKALVELANNSNLKLIAEGRRSSYKIVK